MKNIISLVKNEQDSYYDIVLLYQMMLDNCEKVLKLLNNVFSLERNTNNNSVKNNNVCACEALQDDYTNIKLKYSDLNRTYLYNKASFDQKIDQPFVSTIEKNGIMKETVFTKEELLVLSLAVNHNNSIVNLCNKTDSIRSLMTKGLIKLNDDGLLVVDKIIELLIKTGNSNGCVALNEITNKNCDIISIAWGNFN